MRVETVENIPPDIQFEMYNLCMIQSMICMQYEFRYCTNISQRRMKFAISCHKGQHGKHKETLSKYCPLWDPLGLAVNELWT